MPLKISVVVVTYNRCNSLKLSLKSILNQNRKADEIVILDDGSEDDTIKYLNQLQKEIPNLVWKSQQHSGIGLARKEATKIASGDIIAVLDSDDIFYPNTLKWYIDMFESDSDLDLIYANVARLNCTGNILRITSYQNYKSNNAYKRAIFLKPYVPFKHIAMAFKKTSYKDVGGYDQKCNIKIDIDLMMKFILANKKIKHLNQITSGYRIHYNNVSRNRIKGLIQWYKFIIKYEKNYVNRLSYFMARSIWEISKSGVEKINALMHLNY